jgi:hypothetical protein
MWTDERVNRCYQMCAYRQYYIWSTERLKVEHVSSQTIWYTGCNRKCLHCIVDDKIYNYPCNLSMHNVDNSTKTIEWAHMLSTKTLLTAVCQKNILFPTSNSCYKQNHSKRLLRRQRQSIAEDWEDEHTVALMSKGISYASKTWIIIANDRWLKQPHSFIGGFSLRITALARHQPRENRIVFNQLHDMRNIVDVGELKKMLKYGQPSNSCYWTTKKHQ